MRSVCPCAPVCPVCQKSHHHRPPRPRATFTPHPSLGSAALAMNVANPYVSSHARELTPRGSACVSAARSCVNRSTLTHRLLCPGGIFLPVGILHRNPSALFMHARSSWEGTSIAGRIVRNLRSVSVSDREGLFETERDRVKCGSTLLSRRVHLRPDISSQS